MLIDTAKLYYVQIYAKSSPVCCRCIMWIM